MKRYALLAFAALSLGLCTGVRAGHGFEVCCAPLNSSGESTVQTGRTIEYFYDIACTGTLQNRCCYCLRMELTRIPSGYHKDFGVTQYFTSGCLGEATSHKVTLPADAPSGTYRFDATFYVCAANCGPCTSVAIDTYTTNFTF